MSFISSVPFNVAGPVANVLAVSVAQAMGAAGANPTAKLLLPSAVTAPVLVPGYASETPRAQAKTLSRLSSNQTTSEFTTQLLAQASGSAPEEPAALLPRTQTPPGQVGNKPEGNGGNAPAVPAAPAQQIAAAVPAPANTNTVAATTPSATAAANLTLVTTAPRLETPNAAAGPGQPLASPKTRASVSSSKGAAVYQTANAYGRKLNYVPIEAVG